MIKTLQFYIPNFDGCTEAYSLQDAFVMAKDFIFNALYDKDNPPKPSKYSDVCIEKTPFYIENKSYLALIFYAKHICNKLNFSTIINSKEQKWLCF